MRKLLSALMIALALTTIIVAFDASPAAALGGESLGCYISPSRYPPQLQQGECVNSTMPASSYSATFGVMGESGSYSYAWSVPSLYTSKIAGGCTSGYDYCVLSGLTPTRLVTVSVTIGQNGQFATLSATADIEPWCGNYFCG